jgi:2'-5' RNA ligase
MRLFLALDIDENIRASITCFIEDVRTFAPGARWMKPESLHLTLKFIGEGPDSSIGEIQRELANLNASSVQVRFRGYGFFPAAQSARVFWIGVEAGPPLASLAAAIDNKMESAGIAKKDRTFNPHLTLARSPGASGSPRGRKDDGRNRIFQPLQEQLATRPPAEFGTMTAREFFLYQSQLSPKGSKYTKLATFGLE